MRPALPALVLAAACASAPRPPPPASPEKEPPRPLSPGTALHPRSTVAEEDRYVDALRAEHRALGHIQAVLGWYTGTQGETSLTGLTYVGHDRLFRDAALEAVGAVEKQAGIAPREALALTFLRRSLTGEIVSLATAKYDDRYSDAEAAASVTLPWRPKPVAYRDLQNLIAQEPDKERRRLAFAAMNEVRVSTLNPILAQKEEAAQKAARETGYADYVALSEELRQVDLHALLLEGTRYLQATNQIYDATLDKVARDELGVPRAQLRVTDLARIWKSPRLLPLFDESLELKALATFLSGIGLDLRTAAGTEVMVDDSQNPKKRPRAFVQPVDPPADVRLSVKPSGGLDDYWTLFHEAGHAVHFASSTIAPKELVTLGYGAPTEGFGEFFRHAFSDPRWLARYRTFLHENHGPAPRNAELAAVLRKTALIEMYYLRRYAFAKIAYELRLHGRPAQEIAVALPLLPAPDKAATDLRELYRQLFSVAYGFTLDEDEAQSYLTDVDDTFYSADYARAFVLAGMMHEGIARRFGADWYGNKEVGPFLRTALFAEGTALSAEDVAERLGFSRKLDFAGAARRAQRLVQEADALAGAQ